MSNTSPQHAARPVRSDRQPQRRRSWPWISVVVALMVAGYVWSHVIAA